MGLISCRQENTVNNGQKSTTKTSFDFIEITFNNGFDGITSIHIDTTKILRVRHINETRGVKYFMEQIPDDKITTLNQFASKAIIENADSIVLHPSKYTISYSLVLRQSGKTLQTFVHEDKDYPYFKFRSLTRYLFLLSRNIKENPIDTNFTFKTYQIVCNPPIPPIDTTKFRPPPINANH
jgi:hypothetical protein